jgi:hypothetical protein
MFIGSKFDLQTAQPGEKSIQDFEQKVAKRTKISAMLCFLRCRLSRDSTVSGPANATIRVASLSSIGKPEGARLSSLKSSDKRVRRVSGGLNTYLPRAKLCSPLRAE